MNTASFARPSSLTQRAALALVAAALFSVPAMAQSDAKTKAETVEPAKAPPTRKKRNYRPPVPPRNFTPPVIQFEEPVHEWGTVVRGSVVKHTFGVKNTGGSPLIIERVKAQCGCTAVEKPEQPIPPGASGSITLSVDTKRFKGALKKTADVYSNATAKPIKLTMQGTVEQVYAVQPENPRIEVVRGTASPSGEFILRRQSKSEAKVVEVTTKSTIINASLREVKAGEEYAVDLAIDLANSNRNYFYENVTVKVETGEKTIEIPVRVTLLVKDRIDVNPRSAYFPRKETTELAKPEAPALVKKLTIKSLADETHKFKILSIESDAETSAFETKLTPRAEGREYELEVTLKGRPESATRTLRERLTVKTDDPSQPELKITAMAIFGSR